jgi:hypothetical protein
MKTTASAARVVVTDKLRSYGAAHHEGDARRTPAPATTSNPPPSGTLVPRDRLPLSTVGLVDLSGVGRRRAAQEGSSAAAGALRWLTTTRTRLAARRAPQPPD